MIYLNRFQAAERRQTLFNLYTVDELAQLLDLQPATLATWRLHGEGPKYAKLGKSVFYRHEDVQRWAFEQRLPGDPPRTGLSHG